MHLNVDRPSTTLTKISLFSYQIILEYYLSQLSLKSLYKTTHMDKYQLSQFYLFYTFNNLTMCKPNLIVCSPNSGAYRSQLLNNNIIDRPIRYSYNHEQLINMSNSKYCKNLRNLPAKTIKSTRDLRLNRRKIRTKIYEKKKTVQKMSHHKKA